jgi:hypothetical protein
MRTSACALVLLLTFFSTLPALAAQPGSEPGSPGQGPEAPPPPVAATVDHLLDLQRQAVATQERLIEAQKAESLRLTADPPSGDDPAGLTALRTMRALEEQLRAIRLQIAPLALRFSKIPPQLVPPDALRDLQTLRDRIRDLEDTVRTGFQELRRQVAEANRDAVPGSDTTSPDEPAAPGTDAAAPETAEEAASVVGAGGMETPKQVIELFERVPPAKTPRGSLEYYRNKAKARQ